MTQNSIKINGHKLAIQQKKPKTDWRTISASMSKEEYEILKQIATKNNVSVNQMIRNIMLQVIEENKDEE